MAPARWGRIFGPGWMGPKQDNEKGGKKIPSPVNGCVTLLLVDKPTVPVVDGPPLLFPEHLYPVIAPK